MEYSNNYSKYIEDLKYEKSKSAFRSLVESTKEVKSNDIKVEDVFSKKNGESINYDGSPSKKSVTNTPYEENIIPNKKMGNINSEIIPPKSNDYSSIEKDYELTKSNKESNNLSFDNVDSSKETNDLEYNENYSEKLESFVSSKIASDEKSYNDISKVSDYSEKSGKETDVEETYSEKEFSDIDKEQEYSEKKLSDISKTIDSSTKDLNDISKQESFSSKLDSDKVYRENWETKSYNDISTEREYGTKSFDDIDLEREFPSKEINDITNDRVFLSKSSSKIYNEQDYSSKSSSEIIDSIKNEKKANNPVSLKIDTDNKVTDKLSNYVIANPVKNEATDLVRQYIYFAYDPKDREAELYAKYAKRDKYYPRGSYDQINEVQSESIEDIINTINNPSSFSTFENALVNSFKVASDVLSAVNIIGPAYNIYVDGVTVNNLRQDLRVDGLKLNTELSGKNTQSREINLPGYKIFQQNHANFSYDYTASGDRKSEIEINPNRLCDEDNIIGKIYVIPPYNELAGTAYSPSIAVDTAFTIPLQNNLEFEQISRAAAYNAISFFGRIGDIQQYSRTGSLDAINLTTEYFVDTKEAISGNFSMAHLQDIEMQYRSLVLPGEHKSLYVDNEKDEDDIYIIHFTRPPVINIVMGKDIRNKSSNIIDGGNSMIDNKGVYNNLFTDVVTDYSYDSNTNKSSYSSTIRYKNFIVTNVSIDKSTKTYNYYIDEKNKTYLDTMGFKVTLTVIEVDENYLNSTPSFNNYYNTLAQRSRIGS